MSISLPGRLSPRLWRALWLAALLGVGVFALAPRPLTQEVVSGQDKLEHVLAFLTLQGLAMLALPRHVVLVTSGLLCYAAAIEYLQSFMPGRTASGWDLAASVTGILLAGLVRHVWRRWHAGRSEPR